jgi:hypothetical protein
MTPYLGRLIAGAVIGWFCAFAVLLICWVLDEAGEPGRQYADPLLPCVFIGYLFGVLPGVIVAGVTSPTRKRR